MEYSNSGMITRKEQSADLDIAGTQTSINYNNDYSYQGGSHRIESIQSSTSSEYHQIIWDANGNMTGHYSNISSNEVTRLLCWDEENRLRGVSDNNSLSYYLYSAGIDRAMKLSGSWTQMQVNEFTVVDVADLTDFKLYTSPYMVIDEQGYTKHYYIEGERVSSKLGGGLLGVMVDFDSVVVGFDYTDRDDYNEKRDLLQEDILTLSECMDVSDYINISFSVDWLDNNPNVDEPEDLQYFFHPDHLGSSSFITDAAGDATQFLAYLPFGEQWVDQHDGYDSPYKFSGKELDTETGYNYFGARYYDSGLSVWLSVDPQAEKYKSWTPYNYVGDNPIKRIDPNGEEWVDANGNLIYDPSANDGKGAYTQYASKNDITLGNTLQQTETGQGQFEKLIAPGQKIQVIFDYSTIKESREGELQVGGTQNTTDIIIDFNSDTKEADVKSSVITLYIASIDQGEKTGKEGFGAQSLTGLSFVEKLAAIFGHEIEHTTDENETIKVNKGREAAEKPAYIVSDKIIQEIREREKE